MHPVSRTETVGRGGGGEQVARVGKARDRGTAGNAPVPMISLS